MWKIIVAFIAFAALALYVIAQGGDTLDLGGEKHGAEVAPAASAPAAAASGASH